MDDDGRRFDPFELPEDHSDEFDEHALEDAIRRHRANEFAALAQLNS